MSHHRVSSALTLAILSAASTAFATGPTVLWSDNFDSYASQSQLLANYTGAGSTNTGGTTSQFFDLGIPTPDGGDTTQSMRYHDPLASGSTMPDLARDINPGATPVKATDSTPLIFQYDFYWDGSGNKRTTAGLRNVGGTGTQPGILEMGYYNSAYNPNTQAAGSGFAVRTTSMTGAGSLPEGATLAGWRLLTQDADSTKLLATGLTAGTWIRFTALVRGHSVEYTADVNRDGTIDAHYTAASSTLNLTNTIFNSVRMGGPSGLSSAGGGAYYDNLNVSTVVPGDLNLNGVIDADDYALIDRGMAMAKTGWSNGDIDGSGVVDANDYLLIDTSLAAQGGGHLSPDFLSARSAEFGPDYVASLLTSVPEPLSLSSILYPLSSLLLMRRRSTR